MVKEGVSRPPWNLPCNVCMCVWYMYTCVYVYVYNAYMYIHGCCFFPKVEHTYTCIKFVAYKNTCTLSYLSPKKPLMYNPCIRTYEYQDTKYACTPQYYTYVSIHTYVRTYQWKTTYIHTTYIQYIHIIILL